MTHIENLEIYYLAKDLKQKHLQTPRTKTSNAQSAVDPGSTFNLFLPASIISDLVKYTNLEGERVDGVMWRPTDAIENRALIRAYIHLGAMNQNICPSELIWDMRNGFQLMRCTISRNRFLKLGNMLRFDDKATRTERRERDIIAPIRDVWEKFLITLKKHYNPGPFVWWMSNLFLERQRLHPPISTIET